MLTRLFFAIALLLLACGPTSEPTPEERATVVIEKSDVVLGDDGVELRTQPVCGGIGVGPRLFATVEHCAGPAGSMLSYVDSEKWRTTTNFFEDGTVLSVELGVALVRTVRPLPGYLQTGAALDGAAELVRLVGSDITTTPTLLDARRFDAAVIHGQSGFGLCQGGRAVGVVDTCDETTDSGNDTVCLTTGGTFVGLVP